MILGYAAQHVERLEARLGMPFQAHHDAFGVLCHRRVDQPPHQLRGARVHVKGLGEVQDHHLMLPYVEP